MKIKCSNKLTAACNNSFRTEKQDYRYFCENERFKLEADDILNCIILFAFTGRISKVNYPFKKGLQNMRKMH